MGTNTVLRGKETATNYLSYGLTYEYAIQLVNKLFLLWDSRVHCRVHNSETFYHTWN